MQTENYTQPDSFLDGEERKGFFVSHEMKKVWSVQLELLTVLLDVCQRHNLNIWAEGGTLLGTVREHGYIPWDDDIDMAILRPDYDKLVAIAKDEFKSPYFFQCGYTENKYPRGHAQLRKDGTTAILSMDINQDFHQGIFIDIFVYDAVPDKKEDLDTLYNNCLLIDKLRAYCYKPYSVYNIWKNYKLYKLRKEVDQIGFKNLFAQYDRYLKSYENIECKHVSLIGFIFDFEHYLRDKHVFDDTIYMPFEYIMMPVPIGYDEILTTQYGDYMKPAKAPTKHGGFAVLDTEKSYKEYLPFLRKQYRKEAWKKRLHHLFGLFFKK